MTDFSQLGLLIFVGLIVFLATMLAFGAAVRRRHIAIAPRCTARPLNTIYNPKAKKGDCQDRGGSTWGWIPWTMSLSFDTMLFGIPGTGTRKGGLEGALLKVNLDSIILIKFHGAIHEQNFVIVSRCVPSFGQISRYYCVAVSCLISL